MHAWTCGLRGKEGQFETKAQRERDFHGARVRGWCRDSTVELTFKVYMWTNSALYSVLTRGQKQTVLS